MMDPTEVERLLDLAIAIQQIPAPTFMEGDRARFVQEQFLAAGLVDVRLDEIDNVYARLPGERTHPPLVVTAHTDTVFPLETDLQVARTEGRIAGPGLGDNALGVAALAGLAWVLRGQEIKLPGDLHLVANVGEEGLGDLRGIRAVVDHFGNQVLAYLVLEGIALGHIFNRGMAVQRYRINVSTPGGHSWVDHGSPSAVHAIAALVTHLTALPLANEPRCSLNVGTITGGTSINTIASHASVEVDLRSEDQGALASLASSVVQAAHTARNRDTEVHVELVGQRPAGEIPADHPLVELAHRCLGAQDIEPRLNIGSTDANLPLSRGIPAICIGLTTGGGAHTLNEHIDVPPLSKGMQQLVELVQKVFVELDR